MGELDWTDVDSSNLEAVAFDGRDLFVRFTSGAVYAYAGVPQSVFDDLLTSASKGRFLAQQVKGQFPHRRVG